MFPVIKVSTKEVSTRTCMAQVAGPGRVWDGWGGRGLTPIPHDSGLMLFPFVPPFL